MQTYIGHRKTMNPFFVRSTRTFHHFTVHIQQFIDKIPKSEISAAEYVRCTLCIDCTKSQIVSLSSFCFYLLDLYTAWDGKSADDPRFFRRFPVVHYLVFGFDKLARIACNQVQFVLIECFEWRLTIGEAVTMLLT